MQLILLLSPHEDMLGRSRVDKPMDKYGKMWLHPTPKLRYVREILFCVRQHFSPLTRALNMSHSTQIYIFLIDDVFHWFLMVISSPECRIYQLDSFPLATRAPNKNFCYGQWYASLS